MLFYSENKSLEVFEPVYEDFIPKLAFLDYDLVRFIKSKVEKKPTELKYGPFSFQEAKLEVVKFGYGHYIQRDGEHFYIKHKSTS